MQNGIAILKKNKFCSILKTYTNHNTQQLQS